MTHAGPVSRFGDTAANAGILALLASNSYLKGLPSPIKTIFVSLWYALLSSLHHTLESGNPELKIPKVQPRSACS